MHRIRKWMQATAATAIVAGTVVFGAGPAAAATVTLGQSGAGCPAGSAWSTTTCWNGGVPPANGDIAVVQGGQASTVYDLAPGVLLQTVSLAPGVGTTPQRITGGPIALANGGLLVDSNASALTEEVPGITLDGSATIRKNNDGVLQVNGAITGTGPLRYTPGSTNGFTGDRIVVTTASTYSGSTTVQSQGGGNFRTAFLVDGAVPAGSALTVTIAVARFAQPSTIGSLAGSGIVEVDGNNTLTVGGDDTSTAWSGVMQDNGGAARLSKTGAGTMTVSGTNTHTGTTTVEEGGLTVSATGTIAGPVTVQDGATLTLAAGATISGLVTVQSGGTIVNNGATLGGGLVAVPGAPTGVAASAGNAQATVSFTTPSNNGSAITGYTVTASPSGATGTGTSSPITVGGLANATAYTFTVKATNANGNSPASAASAAVTPAAPSAASPPPPAPTGVRVEAGNGSATVSFTPAVGATSYTVTASPGGQSATGTTSPITVTGLSNGIAYTFVVTASNGGGATTGSPSTAVIPEAPEAPAGPAKSPPPSGNSRFALVDGQVVALDPDPAAMAVRRPGGGHWIVRGDGTVRAFGGAPSLGSVTGRLNGPIVGIAATPSGNGYWLVATDGGVFTFGDARFLGSTGGRRLNRPIVAMAATTSGGGYWLVASDGGVFTFGDALFLGSTGGRRLNREVVTLAVTPTGGGYWLVAADGGVFTFGDARFRGAGLAHTVALLPTVTGYLLVDRDGGSRAFSPLP